MFDKLKRGGSLSASELKKLADMAQRGGATSSTGLGKIVMSGGTGEIPQDAELFIAKIATVSGTGTAAKYGFTEINVVGGTGGVENRVSGRVGTTTLSPARSAVSTATLAVDDRVLIRRNVADVNEYEIVAALAGSQAEGFWAYIISDDGATESSTLYSFRVVTWTSAGGWAFTGAGTVDAKLKRAPIGEYSQVYRKKLQAGDVVRAWPSPTEAGFYECQFEPRTVLKGKLDSAMVKGGSSTMSVYAFGGSAEAWTGETITVFDWVLSTGQTIEAGSNVEIGYMGGRWYVIAAQCDSDANAVSPSAASLAITMKTATVTVGEVG